MKDHDLHIQYLKQAIDLANHNNSALEGGPFGAVIVKEGKVIAGSHNTVVRDTDPTAHAEINALRLASKRLGNYNLSGCVLYSSCEPCPMCLAAIWWARIEACYFAAGREHAGRAGFDDESFYHELAQAPGDRKVPIIPLSVDTAGLPFDEWIRLKHDINY